MLYAARADSVDLLDEADAVRALRHLAGLSISAGVGAASGSVAAGAAAVGGVASRWAVRDLGSSTANGSERAAGSKDRGDDWRDRVAPNSSSAAGKRRWDASGDRRLNGRYTERDRGRDERYGGEAVPAWFTGDASAIALSSHDGQWHTETDTATDEAALEPSTVQSGAQQQRQHTDEQATRFLIDKLGISPLTGTDNDDSLSGSGLASLADTRPAWAVQAERELAEHRAQWSSQHQHSKRSQPQPSRRDDELDEEEARTASEQQQQQQRVDGRRSAASDAPLDDSGLMDVSPEDAARAAALAAAIASESQYDKLDAILAERAKQQQQQQLTNTTEAAAAVYSEEARQHSGEGGQDEEAAQLTKRREEMAAANRLQELIIPAQYEAAQSPLPPLQLVPSFIPLTFAWLFVWLAVCVSSCSVPRVVDPFMGDAIFGSFGGKVS